MQTALDPITGLPDASLSGPRVAVSSAASAVSWQAIAAGTVVAAAVSLLLVTLGAGFGFGALSPWPHAGASAATWTAMSAVGLVMVQWISAGIGGYITGRLRTRWVSLHTHEVFFRDTAHGLITWATATLLVSGAVGLIAAAAAGATAHVASAGGTVAANGATNATVSTPTIDPYDVDVLLRPAGLDTQSTVPDGASNNMHMQSMRILAAGLVRGDIPAGDQAFLSQAVVAQARVSATDATARVDATVARVKADHDRAIKAADDARKAAESASVYTAFAMLLGAFIASIAAALGGHRRDVHA
jgi:hypothetical protein